MQFSEPLRHIDMTADTARRLAALILVAAEGRQPAPFDEESGNVRATVART